MPDSAASRIRKIAGLALIALVTSCSPTALTPSPSVGTPTTTTLSTQRPASAPAPTALPVQRPTAELSPTTASPEPTPTLPPPVSVEHIVESGDTLLGLAMMYNVPMAAVQLANNLGTETGLLAGQVLDIPPASEWPDASPFWVLMAIEVGNTLSQIAAEYDLSIGDLLSANRMQDDDLLHAGQTLILPLDVSAEIVRQPDPAPAPEPPPTDVPEMVTEIDPVAAQPENTPTYSPIVAAGDNATGWASEVFRLINETRAQNGIAPYAYNALLEQAALLHAQDCQQRGSCNHTGSDGSNVRTRVARVGYGAAGAAECIVYSSSPSEAVAWWLDEVPPNDAHLRTLLSTWVTEIGIAVVPNGRGTFYFIADFGRPN